MESGNSQQRNCKVPLAPPENKVYQIKCCSICKLPSKISFARLIPGRLQGQINTRSHRSSWKIQHRGFLGSRRAAQAPVHAASSSHPRLARGTWLCGQSKQPAQQNQAAEPSLCRRPLVSLYHIQTFSLPHTELEKKKTNWKSTV